MAVQRAFDAADRLVVSKLERPGGAGPLPFPERSHQHMLQHRQLVRIVAGVVEHPLHQGGRGGDAEQPQRPLDRLLTLVPGEPRHQVLTEVERLDQPGELRAASEKLRPHGDDDVDRHVALMGGREASG